MLLLVTLPNTDFQFFPYETQQQIYDKGIIQEPPPYLMLHCSAKSHSHNQSHIS